MYCSFPRPVLPVAFAALMLVAVAPAQEVGQRPAPNPVPAAQQPNTDATYQQLRNIGLSGEVAAASNLVLKRDAGTFTFRSGTFSFLAPVNGKVTGAVFAGEGSFTLEPPLEMEKKSLALLSKQPTFTEDFNQLVLRFTDSTYDEIKKAAGASSGGSSGADIFRDIQTTLKKKLNFNLHGRILQDVLSPSTSDLFVAFIKGTKHNGKLLYDIDPHGVSWLGVEPEEVALQTYDENEWGTWAAFHLASEYATGKANGKERNGWIDAEHYKTDLTVEKSGRLRGDVTVTFLSLVDGLRVVPLNLFRTLRVESVTAADGQPVAFIQEDKDDDPDFYIVLPKAMARQDRASLRVVYAGKDAVTSEGAGNYYPVARSTWYPSNGFGEYAIYEMTFRVPKNLSLVGSGTLVREIVEGDWKLSEWKSEVPQGVAGFNLGDFRKEEQTLKNGTVVQAYANQNPPDGWSMMSGGAMGNISTVSLMKKPLGEALGSMEIYGSYFGPIAYKRVSMTQQTACGFGQAWPGLVFMPICSFLDGTQRHVLGLDDTRGYWKSVAAHEVAHQWWGHTVGWNSYRDQWMSEGFAELSASLFMQRYYPKEYREIWKDQLELMTDKNKEGRRAIDVGPLTLGQRLSNSKAGFDIYRRLIYPKGSYVLHMIRMMMWSPKNGDERFMTMMKDFVKTYANQPATTEDFKVIVEKHITPEMDMNGNRKMDWFFNPYVYGTTLPHYVFQHGLTSGPDGQPVLKFTITQSNVDPQFTMTVPVYLELADGKVFRLGLMPMTGNSLRDAEVPLAGLPAKPKRAILNYFSDVLCTQEDKK